MLIKALLTVSSIGLLIVGQLITGYRPGQNGPPVHQPLAARGRLIIKLRQEPAHNFTVQSTGWISLDRLMARYQVKSALQLFHPDEGDTTLKRRLGLDRVYVLTLPHDQLVAARQAFAEDTHVLYAEFDPVGSASATPDDSYWSSQWGLENTGQSGGKVDADINSLTAWNYSTGDAQTLIAIIDTGIDLNHPDLIGKLVVGYDFVNTDSNPQDDHGHGTHVAGIAAAQTNNTIGVAGVCQNCSLMPVKTLNDENWGYYTWWINGIEYAVDHGADVINISAGGTSDSAALHDAVIYAYNAGVPVTAAMMNENSSTPYFPAGYAEAISVGSTDRYDHRSSFSSYGNHIDLVAPGSSIISTMWDNTYATWSGTSMATPHVAGTLGLLRTIDPNLTVEELRSILRQNADDQVGPITEDTPGFDIYFGAGRLNSGKAVKAAAVTPLQTLVIDGPVSGLLDTPYHFTASAGPPQAGPTITYQWQATDQAAVEHTTGFIDTQDYSWGSVGEKLITVLASDSNSQVQDTHTVSIFPSDPPVADFIANRTSGPAPFGVTFTNLTYGYDFSSTWDFGDGTLSDQKDPLYVFYAPGIYSITLNATNIFGSDSEQKIEYITVTEGNMLLVPIVFNSK